MSLSDARSQAILGHVVALVEGTSAGIFEILEQVSGHFDGIDEETRNRTLAFVLVAAIDGTEPKHAARALKEWAYERDELAANNAIAEPLSRFRSQL